MAIPIPPLKLHSDSPTFEFSVTPDEKARRFFEDLEARLTSEARFTPAMGVAAIEAFVAAVKRQPKGSNTFNALNTPLTLFAAELLYPGNALTPIVPGKFLYVVNRASKQILGEFTVHSPPPPFPADPIANLAQVFLNLQPAVIPLPVTTPLNRNDVGLFLSPVQLDADAKQELTSGILRQDDQKDQLLVTPEELVPGAWIAVVPDAREWAMDCNIQFYEPAHDDFDAFLSDPKLAAELFIARTLLHLIKQPNSINPFATNDPLGIRNELTTQPEVHIAEYNGKIKPKEDLYDQAANYLGSAHILPDYALIEKCADRKGGVDKEQQWQATAVVTRKLQNHPIGLLSMEFLLKQDDRMVAKQFVSSLTDLFPAFRHTYLAVLFVFGEFAPAWVRVKAVKSVNLDPQAVSRVELWNLILGLGVIRPSGPYPTIDQATKEIAEKVWDQAEHRMSQNQILGKLPPAGKSSVITRQKRTLEMLTVERVAVEAELLRRSPVATNVLPKFSLRAGSFLKAVPQLAAMVIEMYNLVNNLQGISDPAKSSFEKTVSVVGAGVDFAIVSANASIAIAKLFGALQKDSPLAMKWFRINPYLSCISAVADTIQYSSKALDAGRDGNTALATGNWISAGGSATIAVGATLQIAMSASPAFLAAANGATCWAGFGLEWLAVVEGTTVFCPVVGLAVAAGTALVIAGEVIIFFATRNSFEDFASRSFLGNARGTPFLVKPSWAFVNMPVDERVEEARNLLGLISNFKITVTGNGDPLSTGAFVEIQPYYLEADSRISIQLEIAASNRFGNVETFTASLAVYGADGRTRQTPDDSLIVNVDNPVTELRDDGTVRVIKLPLTPKAVKSQFKTIGDTIPYAGGVFLRTERCLVRVRLEGNRTIVPPPASGVAKAPWCQVNTMDPQSSRIVEGLDEKARVNH